MGCAPKKSVLGREWQQSCVSGGHAACLSSTYKRCRICMMLVNIMFVIGHNLLSSFCLTTRQFRV